MSYGRGAVACLGTTIVVGSMAMGGAARADPGDPVIFEPQLQACVNATLGQTPSTATITEAQAATVTSLTCTGGTFTELTGIEWLTSMHTLDISNGAVLDLSPLENPSLGALTSVSALNMHQTLPDIPVGDWQLNIVESLTPALRPVVPSPNVGVPAIFDAGHDNWQFTDAHAASAGEATLGWDLNNFLSPDRIQYAFSGSVTQSAIWLPPTVTTSPTSVSVMAGAAPTFTASATSNQAPTVQWQQLVPGGSWTDIAGATATTLTVPAVTAAQNGTHYRAVFTNSAGTVNSTAATLTVVESAHYTLHPVAQTAGVGGAAGFRAEFLSDSAAPDFTWEYSTDGGATWQDTNTLAAAADPGDGSGEANAASGWETTLDLTGVPLDMDGWLFRAVVWDEYTDPAIVSEAALLTVVADPVSPTPTASPAVIGAPAPTATATGAKLARTGSTVLPITLGALVLVTAGAGVLVVRRRRAA